MLLVYSTGERTTEKMIEINYIRSNHQYYCCIGEMVANKGTHTQLTHIPSIKGGHTQAHGTTIPNESQNENRSTA